VHPAVSQSGTAADCVPRAVVSYRVQSSAQRLETSNEHEAVGDGGLVYASFTAGMCSGIAQSV